MFSTSNFTCLVDFYFLILSAMISLVCCQHGVGPTDKQSAVVRRQILAMIRTIIESPLATAVSAKAKILQTPLHHHWGHKVPL